MLQQREGNYKTPKHFIVAILVFDDVTIKIRFLIIITNWFMDIGGNCWKIEIRESHNSLSNSRIYTLKRLSNSHHDLRTAIFRARWILLLWSAEKKRASGVPLCILSQEKNNRRVISAPYAASRTLVSHNSSWRAKKSSTSASHKAASSMRDRAI